MSSSPSSSSSSSSSNRPSWSTRLNAPRPIFLGWTAMIFIAGTSYWFVKERNLQKRKAIMRREAEERREQVGAGSRSTSGLRSRVEGAPAGASEEQGEERDKEAALARYLSQGERRERQESGQAGVGGASGGGAQSPLQSLLNQLNRQTSQRRRGGGGEE